MAGRLLRLCPRLCLYDLRRCAVRSAAPPRRRGTRIPAGSVALAGRFCGIYPQETPGGWQWIGRTEVPMWDLSRDPPALLRPRCALPLCAGGARCCAPRPRCRRSMPTGACASLPPPSPLVFQDEGAAGAGRAGVSAWARWTWRAAAASQTCGGKPRRRSGAGDHAGPGAPASRPAHGAGADRGRAARVDGHAIRRARPLRWTRWATWCRSTRRPPGCAAIWRRRRL